MYLKTILHQSFSIGVIKYYRHLFLSAITIVVIFQQEYTLATTQYTFKHMNTFASILQ